jgi:DNA-binding response OmpR family regulator
MNTTMDTGDNSMKAIGKKVVIVEDDVFLGQVLADRMKAAKMDARLFPNAEEALEAIRKDLPDIMLLDIFLPGMNGLDALQQIRKDAHMKTLPVIIVSNTDEAKDRQRSLDLGAKFLIKGASTPDDIVHYVIDSM